MTMIRIAEKKDKKDFYRLWKICFGDSDAFCDWFFENRFSPEHSVVLEEEGEIISCMQAFPYTIQIRGVSIPGTMLCGVSTHPDHRRKGLMGKIFSYEMNHLRKMGYHVAVHTPAVSAPRAGAWRQNPQGPFRQCPEFRRRWLRRPDLAFPRTARPGNGSQKGPYCRLRDGMSPKSAAGRPDIRAGARH